MMLYIIYYLVYSFRCFLLYLTLYIYHPMYFLHYFFMYLMLLYTIYRFIYFSPLPPLLSTFSPACPLKPPSTGSPELFSPDCFLKLSFASYPEPMPFLPTSTQHNFNKSYTDAYTCRQSYLCTRSFPFFQRPTPSFTRSQLKQNKKSKLLIKDYFISQ